MGICRLGKCQKARFDWTECQIDGEVGSGSGGWRGHGREELEEVIVIVIQNHLYGA